jgi:hypothetical protein
MDTDHQAEFDRRAAFEERAALEQKLRQDQENMPTPGLGHGLALAGRTGVEALAGIPGMFADPIIYGARGLFGLSPKYAGTTQEAVDYALGKFGKPQDPLEEVTAGTARAGMGAMTGGLLGKAISALAPSPFVQNLGKSMEESQYVAPKTQAAAGAAGGLLASTAAQLGFGPLTQTVLGIAPGAVSLPFANKENWGAARATKAMGPEGVKKAQDALREGQDIGVNLTLGQASGSPEMLAHETQMQRQPGYAFENFFKQQDKALETAVNKVSQGTDPYVAGLAVKRGIDNFVQSFRDKQTQLWEAFESRVKPNTRIPVDNIRQALKELIAPITGAEKTSNMMLIVDEDKRLLKAIEDDLVVNAQNGRQGLPYEAVKKIRTQIGKRLDDVNLTDKVVRGRYDKMYAALSKDLESMVANSGDMMMDRLWRQANAFTRAGHERIDTYLSKMGVAANDPKETFQTATTPTAMAKGGSRLMTLLKSVPEEQKKTIVRGVIDHLGNPSGTGFDTEKFFQSWKALDKRTKATLFNDPSVAEAMDKIAATAQKVVEAKDMTVKPQKGSEAAKIAMHQTPKLAWYSRWLNKAIMSPELFTNPDFIKKVANNISIPSATPAMLAASLRQGLWNYSDAERRDLQNLLSGVDQGGIGSEALDAEQLNNALGGK